MPSLRSSSSEEAGRSGGWRGALAELRWQHFVGGKSIKQLARATGLSRNTARAALRSEQPPVYRRAPAGSVLDPFKDEIHRLLRKDPALTGDRRKSLRPVTPRVSRSARGRSASCPSGRIRRQ